VGHDHQHHSHRAGARHAGRLGWALVLVLGFLVVQVVVGLTTGSLALLSDAGHMATDALGLGIALAAIHAANRAASRTGGQRTFGLYRLEIIAALANSVLLLGVGLWVLVEAVRRLQDPETIPGVPVFVVGVLGLVVNVVCFLLLRDGQAESLNVRGAYLEVVADLLGSVGVIVAAVLIWTTGWTWVDPVVGAAIGVFVVPRAIRLGRSALHVLVEAAPADIDIAEVRSALAELDGVEDVHDLHVWTLTSDMDVLTAHLVVVDGAHVQPVLGSAREMLARRFHLEHATLQVEDGRDERCHDLSW
jgi:cobalt-zinc-cadmium efflux system protein